MDLRKQFEMETGTYGYQYQYNQQALDYTDWLEQRIEAGQHETIVMWRFELGAHRLSINGNDVATIVENKAGRFIWSLWDIDGVGGQNSGEDTLYEAKVQAGGRAIIDFVELTAT